MERDIFQFTDLKCWPTCLNQALGMFLCILFSCFQLVHPAVQNRMFFFGLSSIFRTHRWYLGSPWNFRTKLFGWWQLKYSLFSTRSLGKCSILNDIFQMSWFNNHLVSWMNTSYDKDIFRCCICISSNSGYNTFPTCCCFQDCSNIQKTMMYSWKNIENALTKEFLRYNLILTFYGFLGMPGICETAGMLTHELFKRSSKVFSCGRTEPPTERYRKIAPSRLHQTLLKDSQSSSKVSFQVAWFLYSCAVLCVSDFVPLGVVQKRDLWVFYRGDITITLKPSCGFTGWCASHVAPGSFSRSAEGWGHCRHTTGEMCEPGEMVNKKCIQGLGYMMNLRIFKVIWHS